MKEENIFSVSQVSGMIQNTLVEYFSNIKIKGEISGFKKHSSGHLYFDLKDENAVINCVMWRGNAAKLKFNPENGLEIRASGSVSTYPMRSNYQLIVSSLQIDGVGALMAMLEERKKRLASEGLFDASRKRKLPFMPQKIGVITSPTGAVIKDILHRISDRFPIEVLLYPVAVQGEGASEQITEAIKFFNSQENPVELLIIARGGGSFEDLMPFNEENVVRATAESKIPTISAVGHETDTTLIDFASDVRAPTPTGAAEMAVPVRTELISGLMSIKERSFRAVNRNIENLERFIKTKAKTLISPAQMLLNMSQRLDLSQEKLNNSISIIFKNKEKQILKNQINPTILQNILQNKVLKLENYKSLLTSYDYKNVMKRGYTITKSKSGEILKSVNDIKENSEAEIIFYDGSKIAKF